MNKDDIQYNGNEPVEFCGEMINSTDKAYLVNDGSHNVWLPKSQLMEEPRRIGSQGAEYEFIIPMWLAVEKGIV